MHELMKETAERSYPTPKGIEPARKEAMRENILQEASDSGRWDWYDWVARQSNVLRGKSGEDEMSRSVKGLDFPFLPNATLLNGQRQRRERWTASSVRLTGATDIRIRKLAESKSAGSLSAAQGLSDWE